MQRHKPELWVVEVLGQDTGEETSGKEHDSNVCIVGPACPGPRTWKKIHRTEVQGAQKRVASLEL